MSTFLTGLENTLLGGSQSAPSQSTQTSTTYTPPPPPDNTGKWIAVGVVVSILAIVTGVLLVKSHNTKAAARAAAIPT